MDMYVCMLRAEAQFSTFFLLCGRRGRDIQNFNLICVQIKEIFIANLVSLGLTISEILSFIGRLVSVGIRLRR